ncbi:MAG: transposase [Acidimicrobiia bacterium]
MAIEATYGWYWAVDALSAAGCEVKLVNVAAVRGFENRRVKNDVRDCELLGQLMRTNTLPEAWMARSEVREQRELVRYRAKLVAVRTGSKAQVHSAFAKLGIQACWSDMFGPSGRQEQEREPCLEREGATALLATMVVILVIGIAVDSLGFGTLERRIRRRYGLATP